jgi:hypothetical protein
MRLLVLLTAFLWLALAVGFPAFSAAPQVPKYGSEQPTDGRGVGDSAGPSSAAGKDTAGSTGADVQSGGTAAPKTSGTVRNWTAIEIVLSCAVLVFGLLVLCLQALLIIKAAKGWHPKSILRVNGLTLIIVSALLLITAGYDAQQVAPVMGLLGTIAGYLLGSGDKKDDTT